MYLSQNGNTFVSHCQVTARGKPWVTHSLVAGGTGTVIRVQCGDWWTPPLALLPLLRISHVHIRPNETTHNLTTSPHTYAYYKHPHPNCKITLMLQVTSRLWWNPKYPQPEFNGTTFVDSLQCHDWLQAVYLAPPSICNQLFAVTLLLLIEGHDFENRSAHLSTCRWLSMVWL